jgi:hypothetical protein
VYRANWSSFIHSADYKYILVLAKGLSFEACSTYPVKNETTGNQDSPLKKILVSYSSRIFKYDS